MNTSPLDQLPVFATDKEIAIALVGKEKAGEWLRKRLPTLEKVPGFPKIDPFHDGRAVPLVKLFYDNYLHLPKNGKGAPDGEEDESVWKRSRRKA